MKKGKVLNLSALNKTSGHKNLSTSLTKKELEIMATLWDAAYPLSSSEICAHAAKLGVALNISTVKVTVKKLFDNGYLRVGGVTEVDINNVLARAFEPTISADDFALLKMNAVLDKTEKSKVLGLFTALLQHENVDHDTLDKLQDIIAEMKQK